MRLAPLAALLALAAPLAAQTPDPTPPEAYFPLEVGNEWIYHAPAFGPDGVEAYLDRRVLREQELDGRLYAVDQLCLYAVAMGQWTCEAERFVRFDPATTDVRRGIAGGGEETVFANLGAPFGGPLGGALDLGTGPVMIGGVGYMVPRVKALPALDFGPPPFAATIGPIGIQDPENISQYTDRFEYARVAGAEYGARPNIPMLPFPDPTPPAAYYPLHAGDLREYRTSGGPFPPLFQREQVVGDTLVNGRTYRVVARRGFRSDGTATGQVRQPIRFDSVLAVPVAPTGDGGEQPLAPCRLDVDFPPPFESVPCGDHAVLFGYGPAERLVFGSDTLVTAVKAFDGLFGAIAYAAGLGVLWQQGDASPQVTTLEYARIAGVTYGEPNPLLPPIVAADETPDAPGLAVSIGPNPTAGPLVLTLDLPTPSVVTLEAFDALGRRVHHAEHTLGAGSPSLDMDASRWAPGLYVVRATTADATATVRVVRR